MKLLSHADVRCAHCGRLPVKSRTNAKCLTCGATICQRCRFIHFLDKHDDS